MQGNQYEIYDMVREQNEKVQNEVNMKVVGVRSQAEQILEYLQSGKTLTTLQGVDMFQSVKLTSRISDLRKAGYSIQGIPVTTTSGKRIMMYRMGE